MPPGKDDDGAGVGDYAETGAAPVATLRLGETLLTGGLLLAANCERKACTASGLAKGRPGASCSAVASDSRAWVS